MLLPPHHLWTNYKTFKNMCAHRRNPTSHMLIIIKSPPGSVPATEAVNRAAELTADIVLTGEAVGLALKDALSGFCGTAFALDIHMQQHLPATAELEKGVKPVSRRELDLMLDREETMGPY